MSVEFHIVIVDDEKNARLGLKQFLESKEQEVRVAESGEAALELIASGPTDLVITDLKMPGMSGVELLQKVRAEDPTIEFIVITAHSTIETAVEAMRMGAYDYLTKPVNLGGLRRVVKRALERQAMGRENERLNKAIDERFGLENIVGNSSALNRIFQIVRQVAPTTATVLIEGESGTGKELIAKAIHFNSPRRARPFVAVNCGAMAPTLLESELFGHEKGAFTGAFKTRAGRFEVADHGTILLDEIGETSPEFQIRLLRVLQDRRFERVGGSKTIEVDVRVIAATNKNLEQCVRDGAFREDLFYRLNVVNIKMPPLRERDDDVVLLANAFLVELGEQYGKAGLRFSPKAMTMLQNHDWPGNVRQLRNVIEGVVVMSNNKEISPRHLPDGIRNEAPAKGEVSVLVGSRISDMEKEMIRATLANNHGNRAKTARQLGIGRKTLYRKMEQFELE